MKLFAVAAVLPAGGAGNRFPSTRPGAQGIQCPVATAIRGHELFKELNTM